MRFTLTFRNLRPGAAIPINYQYELSSWIYRILQEGDSDFSEWLHNHGYRLNGKQFRLFTFSGLQLPRFKREDDRLRLFGDFLRLKISFCIEDSAQHFIMGLFREQAFELGDRISQAPLQVESIEAIAPPSFSNQYVFHALSPICISSQPEGRPQALYHHPKEPKYGQRLLGNLVQKYHAYCLARELPFEERHFQVGQMGFRLLNSPKSRLVTLAAHTSRQTKIRGFMYQFELQTPPELLRFAYQAGVGEKNSMGFGFVGEKRE